MFTEQLTKFPAFNISNLKLPEKDNKNIKITDSAAAAAIPKAIKTVDTVQKRLTLDKSPKISSQQRI